MSSSNKHCPVGFPGLITAIARTFLPIFFALDKDSSNSFNCEEYLLIEKEGMKKRGGGA